MNKYIVLLALFLSGSAGASAISLQSLNIDNSFRNVDNFSQYWQTYATGMNVPSMQSLEVFENVRTGNNSLNRLSIEFDVTSAAELSLTFGLDAHYGAEVYIDNQQAYSEYSDLWWSRNWNHGDVFSIDNRVFEAGPHLIEVFWAEACCNGVNSILLSTDENPPVLLSASNLNAAVTQVSAPDTSSIFMLGFMTIALYRSRSKW
jgi:hypothetical protein